MLYPNPPNERNKGLSVWLDRHSSAANANRVIAGKGVRIKKTTKGTIVEAIPSARSSPFFHPFKIYPATLKDGDDTDRPWRYWMVRGGMVEFRHINTSAESQDGTNFATRGYIVLDGSDGVPGPGNGNDWFAQPGPIDQLYTDIGSVVEDVVLGNTGDHRVADEDNAGRFILPTGGDEFGCVAALFWLQAVRDNSGTITRLAITARTYSQFPGGTGRQPGDLPCSPDVLFIGAVEPRTGMAGAINPDQPDLIVQQVTNNHVVNRYPPNLSWSVPDHAALIPSGPSFYRGEWDDLDTYGLNGQCFYPGDLVSLPVAEQVLTDTGGDSVTIPAITSLYLHVDVHKSPRPPSAHWIKIAGF